MSVPNFGKFDKKLVRKMLAAKKQLFLPFQISEAKKRDAVESNVVQCEENSWNENKIKLIIRQE